MLGSNESRSPHNVLHPEQAADTRCSYQAVAHPSLEQHNVQDVFAATG